MPRAPTAKVLGGAGIGMLPVRQRDWLPSRNLLEIHENERTFLTILTR
jgi:hypothetical protein